MNENLICNYTAKYSREYFNLRGEVDARSSDFILKFIFSEKIPIF